MAPKNLCVTDAFGPTLQSAFLLAGHPEETHDERGKPVPSARTFLLQVQGDRAVVIDELPYRLWRSAWSTSGTAYCAGLASNKIRKFSAGSWDDEEFTDQPEGVIRHVHVSPGQSPEEDTVLLSGKEHLFIRRNGTWQRHVLPEGFALQMVGQLPQVFIGGPELFSYDGQQLTLLDSPEGDTSECLALSADDRLFAGSTYINASTADGGWEQLDTPMVEFCRMQRSHGHIYALSDDDGVVRVYPGDPVVVTRPLDTRNLVALGDESLIATGKDGALTFDGQQWQELRLPTCEVGQAPRSPQP